MIGGTIVNNNFIVKFDNALENIHKEGDNTKRTRFIMLNKMEYVTGVSIKVVEKELNCGIKNQKKKMVMTPFVYYIIWEYNFTLEDFDKLIEKDYLDVLLRSLTTLSDEKIIDSYCRNLILLTSKKQNYLKEYFPGYFKYYMSCFKQTPEDVILNLNYITSFSNDCVKMVNVFYPRELTVNMILKI